MKLLDKSWAKSSKLLQVALSKVDATMFLKKMLIEYMADKDGWIFLRKRRQITLKLAVFQVRLLHRFLVLASVVAAEQAAPCFLFAFFVLLFSSLTGPCVRCMLFLPCIEISTEIEACLQRIVFII